MKFALIGEKLGHSFSKIIHESCGLSYDLIQLKKEELVSFFSACSYDGFNVTIPYKKEVMKYLDAIDEKAQLVGSVNTVVRKDGKFYGYNTDVFGLEYLINKQNVTLAGKDVLILGSGGASTTAVAVCKMQKAKSYTVLSRSGELNYQNCYERLNPQIIINTTPVGMFPNDEEMPVDLDRFSSIQAVFDLIYNPIRTNLVSSAKSKGIVAVGGLAMLTSQALKSQEIWLNNEVTSSKIQQITQSLAIQKNNLVLSGMAGCGKTTIGELLSRKLGLQFFDVDREIEKEHALTPAQIIERFGEKKFREIEEQTIKTLSSSGGKVISLGGGSVLLESNVKRLKRNGIIVYIKRDVEKLVDDDRPLSKKFGVKQLFESRKEIYNSTCDVSVENNCDIETAVKGVIGNYENSCYKWS